MNTRIIVKLDIKPPYVVKPVFFEGLRKIDTSVELAKKYYLDGADEIAYIDIVASLYRREIFYKDIEDTAQKVFIPLSVGGGIKSIEDFSKVFHHGADKVIINTYALQENPNIIDDAAKIFGSQAVVINIEAKKRDGWYECYSDGGKIQSGKNVKEWVKEVESRGAGEILIQSVDNDGFKKGFDIDLIGNTVNSVRIPVVASSGAGKLEDIKNLIKDTKPSGVAIASLFHYNISSIKKLKEYLIENNIKVSL